MKTNNPRLDPNLQKYYSEGKEKDRLATHQLERDRTWRILNRFLPKAPAVILDVGGGAGPYAIPLSARGYTVHLIDPIAEHIDQACKAALEAGVNLASSSVGDARSIGKPEGYADAVLFFGPLYHLAQRQDRLQALQEACRVLKAGGMLFAAGISRFASLMDNMYKGSKFYSRIDGIKNDLKDGVHRKVAGIHTGIEEDMTFGYLHHPYELKQEVQSSGFQDVTIRAIEGPVWAKEPMWQLYENQEGWEQLLDILETIEEEETIIGASGHIMAIGRKS